MACKRYEMHIGYNGVEHIFMTVTWHSAQNDDAKTVQLAASGLDVKSSLQSRFRVGGIAMVYKFI